MYLSNQEKETIILFNEAEDAATVETFNSRLLRQLRKVSTCEGVSCVVDRKGYGVYVVPKSMVKIHAPKKMNLSEEEIERRTKQLKSILN